MGRRRQRRADVDVWGDVVEAPRVDVPGGRRALWHRLLVRGVVWVSVVTWPLVAFALVGVIALRVPDAGQAGVVGSAYSASRAAGVVAVEEWLGGEPSPLPGGRVLTVDEVVVLGDGAEQVWFTLADSGGNRYRSAVLVAVDSRGLVRVVSLPSLERTPDAGDGDGGLELVGSWPGRERTDFSEAVSKAVEQWAVAYTSGDSGALRLAVGDEDASHLYAPLPRVLEVVSEVKDATVLSGEESAPGGLVLAVRAELVLVWAGQEVGPGVSRSGMALDLLVERADTAAPVVTAWGGAGSGPGLVRFANAVAVEGRRVFEPGDGEVEVSVSPSPTPETLPEATESPVGPSPEVSVGGGGSPTVSPPESPVGPTVGVVESEPAPKPAPTPTT